MKDVIYFRTAPEFRRWLETHHDTAGEVWLGFYRKDSGKTGIAYLEAVDHALCFGWIDGIRKRVDETSYTNRFTPRKTRSNWSLINIRRVAVLKKMGLMADAGVKAFRARDEKRSGVYSFENRPSSFPFTLQRRFTADKAAWDFFTAQPPGYRRVATWWVISAKKEETREKRLAKLMDDSRRGRRLGMLVAK